MSAKGGSDSVFKPFTKKCFWARIYYQFKMPTNVHFELRGATVRPERICIADRKESASCDEGAEQLRHLIFENFCKSD
jgi:hypothetical protein